MFWQNFKIAYRHFAKNKLYTAIKLSGLTISLTACVLIGFYLNYELSYDGMHEHADQIVKMNMEYHFGGETAQANVTGTRAGVAFKQDFPEVESFVRVIDYPQVVKYGDKLFEEAHFFFADSTFYKFFSFPLIEGNPEKVLSGPNQLVLSERMVAKYFPYDNPIGKSMNIGGTRDATITGIMKDPPSNTHIKPDFVCSFMSLPQAKPENETWWNANYATYLLLNPHANWQDLEKRIPEYMQSKSTETGMEDGNYVTFHLVPLKDLHLRSTVAGNFEPNGDIRYLYVLGTVALLLLLIGCSIYVNLTTAASAERAREVGVQKVLGAGQTSLSWQHLSESGFLTFGALVLSIFLAYLILPVFNRLFDRPLTMDPMAQPVAWAGLMGLGIVITMVAGFYPTWVISRFRPIKVLKGQFKMSASGLWLRKSLLVFQFAISILLIISTLLLRGQMQYIQNKKLGYAKDQVIVIPSDRQINKAFEGLKSSWRQNAGILSVTRSYDPPVDIRGGYDIGKNPDGSDVIPVTAMPVDQDFLQTMEIPLVAGLDFSPAESDLENRMDEDSTLQGVVLINEAMAGYFGWSSEDAVGKNLRFKSRMCSVKGVFKDFNFKSLHEPIQPLVLFPSTVGRILLVKLGTQDIQQTLTSMEDVWRQHVMHRPFSYEFLDDTYRNMYESEMQTSRVVSAFTWIAIFLSCLGLFGMASYTFVQRTKEISIRKVLGASTWGILGLLSRDFLVLVGISLLVASPIAYLLMRRWLNDFAYRIDISWWVFVLAGLVAVLLTLVTISIQGLKTARTSPAGKLRSE